MYIFEKMSLFKIVILTVFILLNSIGFSQDQNDSTLVIPNVFTPNNDEVNDGFTIYGDSIIYAEKKIYNRHGLIVFQSNQINELWDGRTRIGDKAPEGTYFYIFKIISIYNNEEISNDFKGTVTMLR